eukprot:9935485-Prorocentrum_lima.AAC.1
MTSSLVGSEMCIRDRASNSWRSQLLELNCDERTWVEQNTVVLDIDAPMSVSYTHLTLPTICSV